MPLNDVTISSAGPGYLKHDLNNTGLAQTTITTTVGHTARLQTIDTLPTEVLSRILSFALPRRLVAVSNHELSSKKSNSWRLWMLATVCRKWKEVIETSPEHWGSLGFILTTSDEDRDEEFGPHTDTVRLAALQSGLARSRATPLDIALDASWAAGMQTLMPEQHRIQRLVLAYTRRSTELSFKNLAGLRKLTLACAVPLSRQDFGRPPLLQELSLQHIGFAPYSQVWLQVASSLRLKMLTKLEVTWNLAEYGNIPLPQWYLECPALNHLKDGTNYCNITLDADPPIHVASHLQYLRCSLLYVLDRLSCPALQTFALSHIDNMPLDEDVLGPFLARSGCNLQRVEISLSTDSFWTKECRESVLRSLVNARELLFTVETPLNAAGSEDGTTEIVDMLAQGRGWMALRPEARAAITDFR